jgi:glycosyltransferase involved in cell wall biosynthesis
VRILVLSNLYPPDFIGGYELGCRQAVDALLARGHEVRVLTTAPRTPVPQVPHVRRMLRLTDIYDRYCFPLSAPLAQEMAWVEAMQINAFNVHSLIAELEDFRPDVAYLWLLAGVGGLGLIGCLQHLQVPWVWHLMDAVPVLLCGKLGLVFPALAREFGRQVRGSYLACSRRVVDEIEGEGIRLNGEVEILPNWVAGTASPRRTGYLESGTLRIISAGQIIEQKGIPLLIEAARILQEEGFSNFQVDFFGKGKEDTFQAVVQKHGLSERVRFNGPLPQAELMELYGDYDVFAFPTWEREPFAFAPLEAAARGCVPVLSEICGNAEWMVDGVHCLKTPRTPRSLAAIFQRILRRQVDLAPLGRRAGAVVRRDFHINTVVGRIERALDRAAQTPRPAGRSTADAYRLALLAEKLAAVLVQEHFRAA